MVSRDSSKNSALVSQTTVPIQTLQLPVETSLGTIIAEGTSPSLEILASPGFYTSLSYTPSPSDLCRIPCTLADACVTQSPSRAIKLAKAKLPGRLSRLGKSALV